MTNMSFGSPVTGYSQPGAPFRIGAALSRSFQIFTGSFFLFFVLALLPLLPILLVQLLSGPPKFGALSASSGAITTNVILGFSGFLLGIIANATILFGVFKRLRDEPFTIAESLRAATGRLLPIIGVAIIGGFAAALASIALVIPGIIVMCMFYVAVPVCLIEKNGVFDSLQRSRELSKGYRWAIFGLLLIVAIVSLLAAIPLKIVGFATTSFFAIASVQFLWQTLATAFGAVLHTVVYHDLRVAKEGIDVSKLANVFD